MFLFFAKPNEVSYVAMFGVAREMRDCKEEIKRLGIREHNVKVNGQQTRGVSMDVSQLSTTVVSKLFKLV